MNDKPAACPLGRLILNARYSSHRLLLRTFLFLFVSGGALRLIFDTKLLRKLLRKLLLKLLLKPRDLLIFSSKLLLELRNCITLIRDRIRMLLQRIRCLSYRV